MNKCMTGLMMVAFAGMAFAETLRPGADWKDNTVYTADRANYDVRLDEAIAVSDVHYHHLGFTDVLKTAFFLKGRKNVTLDFAGATVTLHGKLQPFILDGCEGVSIKNVTVRYDRSGYSQGEVVAIAGNTLTVKFDRAKFPYKVEDGALIFYGPTWAGHRIVYAPCFTQFFDTKTRRGKCLPLAFFAPNPVIDPKVPWAPGAFRFTAKEDGDKVVLTSANDLWIRSVVRPGDTIVVSHEGRNVANCLMRECRNTTLLNYRILNGIGMGIFPFHCENILIDGLKLTYDERSPSFISNAADGVHAFSCSGDFTIRNSVIEGTIDDALNVHGNFFRVKSVEGNRLIADTGLEPFAESGVFLPGDRIRVYRGYTLEPTGEYVIVSQRPLAQKVVEFTLDRPAAAHQANDAIENLSAQCKLTLSNCRFGKANSHLRFQTRGGILVENCETEMPFLLTGDMSYWFESSPCETATFRNVKFRTGRAVVRATPQFIVTEKYPYYHGDLLFEGCTFDSGDPISLEYTKSVTMRDCRRADGGQLNVRLTNSGAADAPGCAVHRTTEKQKGLRLN